MSSDSPNPVKAIGTLRIFSLFFALTGPFMAVGIHPSHGEALWWALLVFGSVLFSKGVTVLFCIDLVFVQLLMSRQGLGRIKPNKAVRNFELVSVILLVSVGYFYPSIIPRLAH